MGLLELLDEWEKIDKEHKKEHPKDDTDEDEED
jgi:hypothetical protein